MSAYEGVDRYPEVTVWSKRPHEAGCEGTLYHQRSNDLFASGIVCVDSLGREGNGGIVTHLFRCSSRHAGCGARVLVAASAVHRLAADAEERL